MGDAFDGPRDRAAVGSDPAGGFGGVELLNQDEPARLDRVGAEAGVGGDAGGELRGGHGYHRVRRRGADVILAMVPCRTMRTVPWRSAMLICSYRSRARSALSVSRTQWNWPSRLPLCRST